ncbi:hypothetical protein LX15_005954 [Streptoalloteichus tenebrarius]|uniref:Uncharacterized protein n=1 Tax=Streptoalloteichus tenebrarius (strain ATCC 17920 / DSM 40477 / JCM 4838 / CBS 697.72 / NBRC 16177 / NCIMB 11028 / NRRL B-12390 / A12253. 1 / ISP 5477) TaxID=1933 RepID=A0ABT1I3S3_STRSD|nr:hypothetical protein [Streptoalloteichus tenebrarius]MCP2262220.1 hypothetical protein [Streptoalloteichus tenebrarius]BFF01084.1 hypothetical protein GCM10020241_27590 [Streptoalloteichus tenebrarius]
MSDFRAEVAAKVAEVDSRVTEVDSRVTEVDSRVTEVDSRVAEVDAKIDNVTEALAAVRAGQDAILEPPRRRSGEEPPPRDGPAQPGGAPVLQDPSSVPERRRGSCPEAGPRSRHGRCFRSSAGVVSRSCRRAVRWVR